MRAFEFYLKDSYEQDAMVTLLSLVFNLDAGEITVVPVFTGDESVGDKSLLCILSNAGEEFHTNIVLYPYKEELCSQSSLELAELLAATSSAQCLFFRGNENPYIYSLIDSEGERDILVDDELLEEEDKIRVLKEL